jgi:hypothetical protein
MDAMVFIPVLQAGQFGAVLLLTGSLLAAILGVIAFSWAVVLVWRENNPQGIVMRGQRRLVDDSGEIDTVMGKNPKEKILAWINR